MCLGGDAAGSGNDGGGREDDGANDGDDEVCDTSNKRSNWKIKDGCFVNEEEKVEEAKSKKRRIIKICEKKQKNITVNIQKTKKYMRRKNI